MKGFTIGGTQSGAGKTTLTLGLLAALVRRGLRVVSFKVGPDFIDPGHHTRITGTHNRYCATETELQTTLARVFRSIQRRPDQIRGYLQPFV